jgi:sec-independent protein translocase protein TatC
MGLKDKNELTFLEHLEELRWHIIRSAIAIIIVAIAAFIFHRIIFDVIILAPKTPEFFTNSMFCKFGNLVNVPALCINRNEFEIININMAGQFMTHILVSIIAGIIIAFPYIFFEFWIFLKPALYQKEKRAASGAVFYSSLLFILGVLFGYFIITPLSVHFLGSYRVSEQVTNQINLVSYISTVSSVTLASGLIFELPIMVYFLTKVGLLTPQWLKKYRKHSVIVILALSAIITPPDIFSQVLVCFPLLLLYEIGIGISKRILAKEEAKLSG